MRKNFVFFLMLFTPVVCFGLGDACNSPTEYTVDKRCYVTDMQKQTRPFNAVVGLINEDGDIYCTGTIVKLKDSLYIFTAAHCTDLDGDGLPTNTIRVKLQDNRFFEVNRFINSDYFVVDDDPVIQSYLRGFQKDWAVYKFQNVENVPFVSPTNQLDIDVFSTFRFDYDALDVGYGALKIMSNQDIEDFKQSYVKFLKEQSLPSGEIRDKINTAFDGVVDTIEAYRLNEQNISPHQKSELGFTSEGGISTRSVAVMIFLATNKDLYERLFKDNDKLKVSYCKYQSSGSEKNCQGWNGNSGGGLFDSSGNLMGIHTRGSEVIGGTSHGGVMGTESLLKPNLWSKNPIIDSVNEVSQKQ